MTDGERVGGAPWWASGADDLADDDPFEAHRRARGEDHDRSDDADGGRPWDTDRGWGGDARERPGGRPRWEQPRGVRSGVEDAAEALAALARAAARRAGGEGRDRTGGRSRVHDPACRSCPLCTLTRSLGDARPEVVEHLEQAARHLVLAARAWVDAADERTGRWERIELDDEEQG